MSNIIKKLNIALFIVLLSATAFAQTQDVVSDTLELDQINITASKIPQTARQTTKNVVIINRAEIEKNLSRNLGQLLNAQSGVIVNNAFSNRSANQSIYLQGADNEYTLLLIDGVPVSDPAGNGGALDLRLLPLTNVERVEIVKGSQSTLYGTNAIAGVINVITSDAPEKILNGDGSFSYGSFNTINASANINGGTEKLGYVVNYSYEGSDGISEAQAPASGANFDDDGVNANAFFTKVIFKPVEGLSITPSFNYSYFEAEFDNGSFADADNDLVLELINPAAAVKYKRGTFEVNAFYSYTETSNAFFNAFSPTPFKLDASAQNADAYISDYLSSDIQVLAGFAYQQFETPNAVGSAFDATILSPYASIFYRFFGGFNSELGLRYNIHSEFGEELTYNFSPAYNIIVGNDVIDEIKLHGSVSSGFRAPTLSELFGPFGGNVDLNPERSASLEAGASASLFGNTLQVSVSYFEREIEDLVLFSGTEGRLINANQQDDRGVETSLSYRVNPTLRLSAFYNWLDGEIILDNTGQRQSNLIRRPANRIGFTADANPIKGLNTQLQWIYTGDRDDLFFDPVTFIPSDVELDAYHLVNLFAEYSISETGISIFGDIRNLLDQEYNEVEGFQTPGIHGNLGIRFRLK